MASGPASTMASGMVSPPRLSIHARLNSRDIPVEVPHDAQVKHIKEEIHFKENIPREMIRIIFAGKELQDDALLKDIDIGQNTVVHVIGTKTRVLPVVASGSPLSEVADGSTSGLNVILDRRISANAKSARSRRFYVYCKDCRSLHTGKLRVRCFQCKRGVFLLDREPGGWADVLKSNRIQGVCQSETCDNQIAEFYFKCANHQSSADDQTGVIALYLVQSNVCDIPCLTCTATVSPVLVFPCDPSHVMCLECFKAYCINRLNDRSFIHSPSLGYTIDCPAGCDNSAIEETHHFRLLEEEQYDRYQRFGTEECLLRMGGVFCPTPGCGAGLVPDEDVTRVVCRRQGGQGCGAVFCKKCLIPYYQCVCSETNMGCSLPGQNHPISHQNPDERATAIQLNEERRQKITKPCPQCRVLIHKSGGCMHITCSHCKHDWCWDCESAWTRDCQADHWFG